MFSENRYRHCYAVGRKMYDIAKSIGWSEQKAVEMFILGNVHDIGYEFKDTDQEQADLLFDALFQNYKYAREIKEHVKLSDYRSNELDLLYYADMTVDGQGNNCTIDERLKDLKIRHGENSDTYKDSLKIYKYLKKKNPYL